MRRLSTAFVFLSLVLWGAPLAFSSFQRGKRASISSDNFHIDYPIHSPHRDVEEALRVLESARANLLNRLSAAGVNRPVPPTISLFIYETTGDFVGSTGQPPWVAAASRGGRIEIQPLSSLRRRGVLASTLRHEYIHVAIGAIAHGRAPRWMAEGVSIYMSDEGIHYRGVKSTPINDSDLNRGLERPTSPQEMRALYATAYRRVLNLIKTRGEQNLWRELASN